MADVVKASFDVCLEYPLRTIAPRQRCEALLDCICNRPLGSEPIRVPVRRALGDWFQREQVERLHRPVFHRRDSERTHLAVALRDVHPPQRARLVTAPFERQHGLRFGFRRGPEFMVHARCSFALILRHSSNGQGFAAQRAGQHSLQSACLATSAFLPRLHDTQLQTSHSSLAVGPLDVPPIDGRAGARVRRGTLLCAALRRGIAVVLVMMDQAKVCALSRGMMSALHLNPYPPRYRPAFASSAFLYPHPPQPPSRSACPSWAPIRVYRVPHE